MSSLDRDCGVADFCAVAVFGSRSGRPDESEDEDAVDAGGAGFGVGGAPRVERRGEGMARNLTSILRYAASDDWRWLFDSRTEL